MIQMDKYLNKKTLILGGLILTICGSTSLAYFADKIDIKPELTIQMGNLNTKIIEPINIEGLDIDNYKTDEFSIKNTGTLEQSVAFSFSNSRNIEEDGLEKLGYEIVFTKSNGEQSKLYEGVMTELFSKPIYVEDESGNKIILKEDELLEATIKVTMDKAMPYKYSNQDINFDMVIDTNQINEPIE